ncbi:transcriptional regulator of stress [Bacillus licheniformis]|nr:transcriptional regulator of stress [Bacillus licheniformis]
MEELTFYSYPSCTSCRKTKHWLKANQVDFTERHLFRETPNQDELKHICLSRPKESMKYWRQEARHLKS